MNLTVREKSETAAFVRVLHYYQKRLSETEQAYAALQTKVDEFVQQVQERCEEVF